jgi:SAM-dependent methyltransferase
MHQSAEAFVRRICTAEEIRGRRALEVGSYTVNGSARDWLTPFGPAEYMGIDLTPQPQYVDLVLDAPAVADHFGPESFDVVLSTEMLEHCSDPLNSIRAMVDVLRPGGLLLLTARGPGFPYHCPPDRWRFTCEDFRCLQGFDVIELRPDDVPGVLFAGRKTDLPNDWQLLQPTPMPAPYHTQQAFDARMAARRSNPITPDPFSCWYHVACMGNWREVFTEQLSELRAVGIEPTACVLGTPDDVAYVAAQIPVAYSSSRMDEYEIPTLQRAYDWAREHPTGAVLYLHTKGVSAPADRNKTAWRRLMSRLVVDPWREHLQQLSLADMVGPNWQTSPKYPHFQGNFWLARSDWLSSLATPIQYQGQGGPTVAGNPWRRMSAELWVGSQPYHHVISLGGTNQQWCWHNGAIHVLAALNRQGGGD